MSRPRLVPFALAALAAASLAVGCGGEVIDARKLEAQLPAKIERELGLQGAAHCPADVELEPQRKFRCRFETTEGNELEATIKITNRKGDVRLVALSEPRD